MNEKNRFHHGDLKNEIIRQGLKLIHEKGFQSVELKDISHACHVSTPSIYKHFDGKSDLMATLLIEVSHIFYNFLKKEYHHSNENAEEDLMNMGMRFLQFSQESPHYFEFLFYSKFERHVQLDVDIQIDYNDENNSFNLFKEVVIRYLKFNGIKLDYNRHIVNLWSYISGLSIVASSIDSEDKNKVLTNYIRSMVELYTLGIKQEYGN
ncbi:TetR/AcrR family transcriptional regulator [uncultured Streptococcus sp.]|uniref:TetR/AcrR family transcriptional regulator n=1 Tax=uncultured Streptococcus sp. TaxID=83427 RepID=UPI00258F3A64|nr:TetR/AcrR family transcriptional regulator [uncultured Streptococcus sp.]